MYIYKSLTNISYDQLHAAFEKAFADYIVPFQLSVEELSFMINRRGYRSEISFGAFYDDELVGFTLNGVGDWNGKLTAYDTGTGVILDHRKRGLAKNIFLKSIPVFKKYDIEQYLLEVIDTNAPAIDLYKKMGFKETRKFDFQKAKISKLNLKPCDSSIKIEKSETTNWNEFSSFWNSAPSWQNSIDSINRKKEAFVTCSAQIGGQTIGYGVMQKSNGDIPQIAVHKNCRKKHIASSLLAKLSNYSDSDTFRFINTNRDDEEIRFFFNSLGIKKEGGQLEMIKML